MVLISGPESRRTWSSGHPPGVAKHRERRRALIGAIDDVFCAQFDDGAATDGNVRQTQLFTTAASAFGQLGQLQLLGAGRNADSQTHGDGRWAGFSTHPAGWSWNTTGDWSPPAAAGSDPTTFCGRSCRDRVTAHAGARQESFRTRPRQFSIARDGRAIVNSPRCSAHEQSRNSSTSSQSGRLISTASATVMSACSVGRMRSSRARPTRSEICRRSSSPVAWAGCWLAICRAPGRPVSSEKICSPRCKNRARQQHGAAVLGEIDCRAHVLKRTCPSATSRLKPSWPSAWTITFKSCGRCRRWAFPSSSITPCRRRPRSRRPREDDYIAVGTKRERNTAIRTFNAGGEATLRGLRRKISGDGPAFGGRR